ncbi:putative serine/threonine-protein kinase nek2 [Cucumis melo var. makuwa]|uniref:Serine/threonine-protein kinase nek2 n=1 Tax=Cucumis melo var. makuwa TaxID=1194695 RepID=A0A5D3BYC6_CUCMM|nr:putative serine/threonine-protein kinase nek2 [Cucumis melo var. makuwa]TYK03196.1 putative serine/threonine-protein kinase nek2 [Cucumis melo var. makuwa]
MSKYTHNMSRRGYANLAEDMKNGPSEKWDFGRANMWKKARTKKNGGYINEDVQQVANQIDEILDKLPMMNHPMMHYLKLWVLQNMRVEYVEKVLENVVKEKKEIATSLPPISLTSKKKVVEEEEVIVTRPSISKNEINVMDCK